MGSLCDCLNYENEIEKQTHIQTMKILPREEIMKQSILRSYCEGTGNNANKSLINNPFTMKESLNPFPQMINEKGKLSVRMSCPNNPNIDQDIIFDSNDTIKCLCVNSEITKEAFILFLNKYSIGTYRNHNCDLHQAMGEYCTICNNWVCGKCKTDYHNKHYLSHHFVSFKSP